MLAANRANKRSLSIGGAVEPRPLGLSAGLVTGLAVGRTAATAIRFAGLAGVFTGVLADVFCVTSA